MIWGNHLEQSADGTPCGLNHRNSDPLKSILFFQLSIIFLLAGSLMITSQNDITWFMQSFFFVYFVFNGFHWENQGFFLPQNCPKTPPQSPFCSKELSQLDRAGDLYDSIAERLYDAMAGLHGMDLDGSWEAKLWWYVKMLSQQCLSDQCLANLMWEART